MIPNACNNKVFYDPNEYLWIDPSKYILPFYVCLKIIEWYFGQILSKIFVLSYVRLVRTVSI